MKYYPFINFQIHILIGLTVFALPISHFTGVKTYQLVIISLCLSMIALFVQKLLSKEGFRPELMKSVNMNLFVAFIILGFVSGVFQNGLWKAILGSIEYLVVFGLFLFLAFLNFPFRRYMSGLIVNLSMLAFIVGILGVYQYFIDSELFGMYSDTLFIDINSWTVKRVPSILGSIQVFAAFMTYVILLLFVFRPFREKINSIVILLLAVLGSFSGSFLFYGSILMIFIGLILKNKKTITLFLIILLSLSILLFDEAQVTFGPIIRLFSIFNLGGEFEASNSERFTIWSDVIRQTPFFYGNGFGQASMLVDGLDRFNTESYLFSIFYQTGILGTIFMVVLLANLIFSASRGLPLLSKIIILSIVGAYLLGVHVFYSIMMLPFWLLIVQTKQDY